MVLEVGQVFAGYTILRVLGAGGMGTVYLASHPRLPRQDALKVLPADVTGDPEFRARFLREADLAASLSHPHIVGIHDRGEHDGQFWISMDYVAGTDADQLVSEQFPSGMPVDQVVTIITAVASALDYAHHRGLLHRDIKPANILLTQPDGQPARVFLADFGLARRIDDASGLTATNFTVGTAAYAAPEQLTGDPMDGRADQYALACTAFHLLTGVAPYGKSNLGLVISQHITAPPPSLAAHRPELAGLDPVFATAMAKRPADRFGSCQEFAQQLAERLTVVSYPHDATALDATMPAALPQLGEPPGRRRRVLIGALAAIVLLVVAVGVVAAVKLTGQRQSGTTAAPPTATAGSPEREAGPFTGMFRANFGAGTNLDNAPTPGATPTTAIYAVRSSCTPAGCVATASRVSGELRLASTMVFDKVDGRWVAVALGSDRCRGTASEFWQVFSLQPGPEGTLTGEYRAAARNACNQKRSVTFTRTGDVDINSLPDPDKQPRRMVSPAEALHGSYHVTRTFSRAIAKQEMDYAVITDCLRSADRCMSYFHSPSNDTPLVFDGASWVLDVAHDESVAGCTALMVKTTGDYPLPQPPENPIAQLTGHGTHQQTGTCAVNVEFDEIYSRIRD
ncbi:serine/threonine-protein kinase [Mycobacterium szulgai]|uniref:non-specific serine/threonine protein kinase n=1 Tax=Mycobacterium szulgai TaxID=1787 RepID=A0A1X2EHX2_MYCSZ|nr:serine/threonine-protein kinase [Mycobacterium szulgai]MCV7079858.1 serine/threonine protein kinase [Mycobacterium szulgai]ORX02724.1 hypothetical protein AWC27_28625 [Mycobacterium szulgai]